MHAIVPIKGGDDKKTRLAPALSPDERRALSICMLTDVLSALSASQTLDGITVVSGDSEALRIARELGATIYPEPSPLGHSGAVATVANQLFTQGVEHIFTVPGDVPLLSGEDVDTLTASAVTTNALILAPSWSGTGTNALVCSSTTMPSFHFGNDSLRLHLAAARQSGITTNVVNVRGAQLDIDTPDDLDRLMESPGNSASGRFLRRIVQPLETRSPLPAKLMERFA